MSDAEDTLKSTADATIRVPANLMALIRQSYDSREKALDWMLAIGTVAAMAYLFRAEIRAAITPDPGPNAGLPDPPQPNQELSSAFSAYSCRPDLYSYNMPSSRRQANRVGPSGTAPPRDPSSPPQF